MILAFEERDLRSGELILGRVRGLAGLLDKRAGDERDLDFARLIHLLATVCVCAHCPPPVVLLVEIRWQYRRVV